MVYRVIGFYSRGSEASPCCRSRTVQAFDFTAVGCISCIAREGDGYHTAWENIVSLLYKRVSQRSFFIQYPRANVPMAMRPMSVFVQGFYYDSHITEFCKVWYIDTDLPETPLPTGSDDL